MKVSVTRNLAIFSFFLFNPLAAGDAEIACNPYSFNVKLAYSKCIYISIYVLTLPK